MSEINIYNMDCMELMRNTPDNFYNLAIVDVPYGIGEDGRKTKGRSVKKDGSFIKKIDVRNGSQIVVKPKKYHHGDWDNKSPDLEYFNELKRVSKNQIIWGANHFIEKIPKANSSCWIVWDKCNGATDFADCELAYSSFKTAVRMFRFMWSGFKQGKNMKEGYIMNGNMKKNEQRIHPCQKPVKLYEWLLMNYAKEADKILDTHLGSGSIAIACHNLKFDLTACELDKEYYKGAMLRLKIHQMQKTLF